MLERAALSFLNHLLVEEGWALPRLKPFAGQHARFNAGPLSFGVTVAGNGSLQTSDLASEAQVTITLPDDTPIRLLTDRSSIFQSARIAGSADFAEALGFVVRNVRWDAEADLARIVGDVPARRIRLGTEAFLDGKRTAAERLAANISEFLIDEEGLVLRPSPLLNFYSEVERLRDDLARLENRVSRL
jgi:ubiquinone biosynthesis protein UbiJ